MSTDDSDNTIVLDLDSTLIYTIDDTDAELGMIETLRNNDRESVYKVGSMVGTFRPYLKEFMIYCNQNFQNIVAYTAGTKPYGQHIVLHIERFTKIRFHKILTRDECLLIDDDLMITQDNIRKPLPLVLPEYNIKTMLLVDDKFCNFRFNPRNGILIPSYSPTNIDEATSDNYLLQLMEWFNTILGTTDDYRLLNKDNIFNVHVIVDIF